MVDEFCAEEDHQEWDVDGLLAETNTYWPSELNTEQCLGVTSTAELEELMLRDAHNHFERREVELGEMTMREVERQVLLRIVDQRWREQLYEMDYLREGIHLRGIGQKDPVAEWQREGFDMFSSMLTSVYRDFVKYAMHAEVVTAEEQQRRSEGVTYSSSDNSPQLQDQSAPAKPQSAAATSKQSQVVKTAEEKIGRNDPCHSG